MKNDAPQTLLNDAVNAHVDTWVPITVAHGDGIGPEIMAATLKVLAAAGARIVPETIEIGENMYLAGHSSGIAPEAWEKPERYRPQDAGSV